MASDRSECPVSRRDAGIAAGLRLGNCIPAGIQPFLAAVTDKYALKSVQLTIEATLFCGRAQHDFRIIRGVEHYKVSVSRKESHFYAD